MHRLLSLKFIFTRQQNTIHLYDLIFYFEFSYIFSKTSRHYCGDFQSINIRLHFHLVFKQKIKLRTKKFIFIFSRFILNFKLMNEYTFIVFNQVQIHFLLKSFNFILIQLFLLSKFRALIQVTFKRRTTTYKWFTTHTFISYAHAFESYKRSLYIRLSTTITILYNISWWYSHRHLDSRFLYIIISHLYPLFSH